MPQTQLLPFPLFPPPTPHHLANPLLPPLQKNYLFRAACSELRTEILNTRKSTSEKMTTQRAHLQYEVDILSQRSSSESLALKDDLRGLLNDRKMAVRMEQQQLESQIQELNYKITVALNSDSKSEVEGLRWVLTRRAALAIAGFACTLYPLSSLSYPQLPSILHPAHN